MCTSAPSAATAWENVDDIFQYDAIMKTKKAISKKREATESPASASSSSKKTNMVQCGLVSRQQEFNELGSPDLRSGCYGCCYIGEQEAGATPIEEIVVLMNMIRKCYPKTDHINLAIHVAAKYEKIRSSVNSKLMPGESPLPEWKAATILHHLRMHNVDPELQTCNRMFEMQEVAQVALNAAIVKNPDTGEMQVNIGQAKMYLEFHKSMEALSKTDVTTKLGYSGGNHVDLKSLSEGPISYSGKALMSIWGEK